MADFPSHICLSGHTNTFFFSFLSLLNRDTSCCHFLMHLTAVNLYPFFKKIYCCTIFISALFNFSSRAKQGIKQNESQAQGCSVYWCNSAVWKTWMTDFTLELWDLQKYILILYFISSAIFYIWFYDCDHHTQVRQ